MKRELCPYEMNIKCGYVVTRKDGTKFCSQDMDCEASNKWLSEHDSELLDKVAYRINQRKESNKICLQNALNKNDKEDAQYFRNLLFEDDLVTDIIAEMKAEVNE